VGFGIARVRGHRAFVIPPRFPPRARRQAQAAEIVGARASSGIELQRRSYWGTLRGTAGRSSATRRCSARRRTAAVGRAHGRPRNGGAPRSPAEPEVIGWRRRCATRRTPADVRFSVSKPIASSTAICVRRRRPRRGRASEREVITFAIQDVGHLVRRSQPHDTRLRADGSGSATSRPNCRRRTHLERVTARHPEGAAA